MEEVQEVTLDWRGGGSQILLAGEFSNWEGLSMVRVSDDIWNIKLKLKRGEYMCKFIADGVWKTSDDMKTITDNDGNLNNLLIVENKHPPWNAFPETTSENVFDQTRDLLESELEEAYFPSAPTLEFAEPSLESEADKIIDYLNEIIDTKEEVSEITLKWKGPANTVTVLGDFSNWKELSLTKVEKDLWKIQLKVKNEQHLLFFHVDGERLLSEYLEKVIGPDDLIYNKLDVKKGALFEEEETVLELVNSSDSSSLELSSFLNDTNEVRDTTITWKGLAKSVMISGDFSNWVGITMTNTEEGLWKTNLKLKVGQYLLMFFVDGEVVLSDSMEQITAEDDEVYNLLVVESEKGNTYKKYSTFDNLTECLNEGPRNDAIEKYENESLQSMKETLTENSNENMIHTDSDDLTVHREGSFPTGETHFPFDNPDASIESNDYKYMEPDSVQNNTFNDNIDHHDHDIESMETTIFWNGHGKDVKLIGEFSHWKELSMSKQDDDIWAISLKLKRGSFLLKFIIDGTYKLSDSLPRVSGPDEEIYNQLEINSNKYDFDSDSETESLLFKDEEQNERENNVFNPFDDNFADDLKMAGYNAFVADIKDELSIIYEEETSLKHENELIKPKTSEPEEIPTNVNPFLVVTSPEESMADSLETMMYNEDVIPANINPTSKNVFDGVHVMDDVTNEKQININNDEDRIPRGGRANLFNPFIMQEELETSDDCDVLLSSIEWIGHADDVRVIGEFSNWEALTLSNITDDKWRIDLKLKIGRHLLKFIVDRKFVLSKYIDKVIGPDEDIYNVIEVFKEKTDKVGYGNSDNTTEELATKFSNKILDHNHKISLNPFNDSFTESLKDSGYEQTFEDQKDGTSSDEEVFSDNLSPTNLDLDDMTYEYSKEQNDFGSRSDYQDSNNSNNEIEASSTSLSESPTNLHLNFSEVNGPVSSVVHTSVNWRGIANKVSIIGEFSNWEQLTLSSIQEDIWTLNLKLNSGQYLVKFIVDDQCVLSKDYGTGVGPDAEVYNILEVDSSAESSDVSQNLEQGSLINKSDEHYLSVADEKDEMFIKEAVQLTSNVLKVADKMLERFNHFSKEEAVEEHYAYDSSIPIIRQNDQLNVFLGCKKVYEDLEHQTGSKYLGMFSNESVNEIKETCVVWEGDATDVKVFGEFSNWVPLDMSKSDPQKWTLHLKQRVGQYLMRFVIDGEVQISERFEKVLGSDQEYYNLLDVLPLLSAYKDADVNHFDKKETEVEKSDLLNSGPLENKFFKNDTALEMDAVEAMDETLSAANYMVQIATTKDEDCNQMDTLVGKDFDVPVIRRKDDQLNVFLAPNKHFDSLEYISPESQDNENKANNVDTAHEISASIQCESYDFIRSKEDQLNVFLASPIHDEETTTKLSEIVENQENNYQGKYESDMFKNSLILSNNHLENEKLREKEEKIEDDMIEKEEIKDLEPNNEDKENIEIIKHKRNENERVELDTLEKENTAKEKLEEEKIKQIELHTVEREKSPHETKEKERPTQEGIREGKRDKERTEGERKEQQRIEQKNTEYNRRELEIIEQEMNKQEKLKTEGKEAERIEQETAEQENREKIEQDRIRKENRETKKENSERTEEHRIEHGKNEKERIELERQEEEHIEQEKIEQIKIKANTADEQEKADLERERMEEETLSEEKREKERIELEKKEKQRIEQEIIEKERIEFENMEKGRIKQEKTEREILEAEKVEEKKREKIEAEQEQREKEILEQERIKEEIREKNKIELMIKEQHRIEEENIEIERMEQERINMEKIEKERLELEKIEQEKAEQEQRERERIEQERINDELREKERIELERKEQKLIEQVNIEKERIEQERSKQEKIEKERLELEKIEQEKAEEEERVREIMEQERINEEIREKEKNECERREQERIEKENIERERMEQERIKKVKLEKETLESEKLEQKKAEQEQREREMLEQEEINEDIREKENIELVIKEQQRFEQENIEIERIEQEMINQEDIEKERLELEQIEQEKLEQKHRERERMEQERINYEMREKERIELDRKEQQLIEQGNIEKERIEHERIKQEKIEKERLEFEKIEQEKAKQDQGEIEILENQRINEEIREKEKKELVIKEQQRIEQNNIEMERLKKEMINQEKLEKERSEFEKMEKEKAEHEQREKEALEQERINEKIREKEKIELVIKEQQRIEQENIEIERMEQERINQEKKENERLKVEKIEQEKAEQEHRERERLDQERINHEIREKERIELERKEQHKIEQENNEKETNEQERIRDKKLEKETLALEKIGQEKDEQGQREKEILEQEIMNEEVREKDNIELVIKEQQRIEQESIEIERMEQERIKQEKIEKERIELEKIEQEHRERETMEQERINDELREKERIELEKKAQKLIDQVNIEKERIEQERINQERIEKERLEWEKIEQDKSEEENRIREIMEQERINEEIREKERIECERKEQQSIEQKNIEKERIELERMEQERIKQEKIEQENRDTERMEQERIKEEIREKEIRERERKEQQRIEMENIEKERIELKRHEQKMFEQKKMEKEKIEADKVEQENRERMEQEKIIKMNEEQDKIREENRAKERIELERKEQQMIEQDSIKQEKIEMEKIEQESIRQDLLDNEFTDMERVDHMNSDPVKGEKESVILQDIKKGNSKLEAVKAEKIEKESNENKTGLRIEKERGDLLKERNVEEEKNSLDMIERERLVQERKQIFEGSTLMQKNTKEEKAPWDNKRNDRNEKVKTNGMDAYLVGVPITNKETREKQDQERLAAQKIKIDHEIKAEEERTNKEKTVYNLSGETLMKDEENNLGNVNIGSQINCNAAGEKINEKEEKDIIDDIRIQMLIDKNNRLLIEEKEREEIERARVEREAAERAQVEEQTRKEEEKLEMLKIEKLTEEQNRKKEQDHNKISQFIEQNNRTFEDMEKQKDGNRVSNLDIMEKKHEIDAAFVENEIEHTVAVATPTNIRKQGDTSENVRNDSISCSDNDDEENSTKDAIEKAKSAAETTVANIEEIIMKKEESGDVSNGTFVTLEVESEEGSIDCRKKNPVMRKMLKLCQCNIL